MRGAPAAGVPRPATSRGTLGTVRPCDPGLGSAGPRRATPEDPAPGRPRPRRCRRGGLPWPCPCPAPEASRARSSSSACCSPRCPPPPRRRPRRRCPPQARRSCPPPARRSCLSRPHRAAVHGRAGRRAGARAPRLRRRPAAPGCAARTPRSPAPAPRSCRRRRTAAPPRLVAGAASEPVSTWSVTYVGFPAAAQAAFQRAVDLWAGIIASPVPIRVCAPSPTSATPACSARPGRGPCSSGTPPQAASRTPPRWPTRWAGRTTTPSCAAAAPAGAPTTTAATCRRSSTATPAPTSTPAATTGRAAARSTSRRSCCTSSLRDLGYPASDEGRTRAAAAEDGGVVDLADRQSDGSVGLRTLSPSGELSVPTQLGGVALGRPCGGHPRGRHRRGLRPRHRDGDGPPSPHGAGGPSVRAGARGCYSSLSSIQAIIGRSAAPVTSIGCSAPCLR